MKETYTKFSLQFVWTYIVSLEFSSKKKCVKWINTSEMNESVFT